MKKINLKPTAAATVVGSLETNIRWYQERFWSLSLIISEFGRGS